MRAMNGNTHFLTSDHKTDITGAFPHIRHPVYLSIDVDCYEGVNAKEYKFTPLRGWMSLNHMKSVLSNIPKDQIWGLDLCEITNLPNHQAAKYATETYFQVCHS